MSTPDLLGIPAELRNRIYELVLMREHPIDQTGQTDGSETKLHVEVLRVNKTIHREATSVFYGMNTFISLVGGAVHLEDFVRRIGPANARYIRNIDIKFPDFSSLDAGQVHLESYHDEFLVKVAQVGFSVSTLTLTCFPYWGLYTADSDLDEPDALENGEVMKAALGLVNARLRDIPSFEMVNVEVPEEELSEPVTQEMQKLGWAIKSVKDEDEVMYYDPIGEFYDS